MKARLLAVAAAVLVAAAVFTPGVFAATAEPATITGAGWWALATGVPEPTGGMQIAQTPTGSEMSIGAIKIKLNAAKLASVLLVLNEASTSSRSNGAGMMACLTTADWKPGNPALWTDLPKRDCSRSVQMVRSATQLAWSANIGPLLAGKTGTVGVMFIPGAPPPGSIPIPSLSNLPVQLPALPLPVVGGLPIPPPAVTALLPPLPDSIAFPAQIGYMIDISSAQLLALADTGLGGLSPTGGSLPSVTAPSTAFEGDTLQAAPPLASSTSINTGGANATAPTNQPLLAVPVSHGSGKPWGRAFALFPLAVMVGVAGTVIRRLRPGY